MRTPKEYQPKEKKILCFTISSLKTSSTDKSEINRTYLMRSYFYGLDQWWWSDSTESRLNSWSVPTLSVQANLIYLNFPCYLLGWKFVKWKPDQNKSRSSSQLKYTAGLVLRFTLSWRSHHRIIKRNRSRRKKGWEKNIKGGKRTFASKLDSTFCKKWERQLAMKLNLAWGNFLSSSESISMALQNIVSIFTFSSSSFKSNFAICITKLRRKVLLYKLKYNHSLGLT